MELILISNTKLKIMLDESDMKQYKISDDTDCATLAARKAIRSILDTARQQVGFNTEGSEIFVQLYTSKRGGCELFVSKSELEGAQTGYIAEQTCADSRHGRRGQGGAPAEKKKYIKESAAEGALPAPQKTAHGRIAFSFPDLKSLFSVCKALYSRNILPESRAYLDGEGNCFLVLFGTGLAAYSRLDRLTFILEFGRRENSEQLSIYISEHCRELCGNRAIETLSEF